RRRPRGRPRSSTRRRGAGRACGPGRRGGPRRGGGGGSWALLGKDARRGGADGGDEGAALGGVDGEGRVDDERDLHPAMLVAARVVPDARGQIGGGAGGRLEPVDGRPVPAVGGGDAHRVVAAEGDRAEALDADTAAGEADLRRVVRP